ncbi:MAG TPA: ribonuclease D [Steroidobacteraceae bacterium]|nr:ribonuclease D [Steroidobacteraceae bacterium]
MTPVLLSDQPSIDAVALRLVQAPWIALDTEFLRERTYRPQLCLLQLATPDETQCVDPLGGADLAPLRAALTGGAPKIMHAARQDLEVLWPVYGAVAPVFDTQVAAALAGFPAQIGYSELVRQLLDTTLEKGQTRTDWSRRPLSEAQLRYAIDDVAHLAELRDALLQKLEALGRLAWLDEELHDLAREDRLFVDPERAHERLRFGGELDPDRERLLRLLAAWRERRASERDRPRNWILDDTALRAMVLKPPRNAGELAAVEGIAPGFVERSGAQILRLVEEAALPAQLPPPASRPRADPELQALTRALSAIVQRRAAELGLVTEVLATRRELESIARGGTDAPVLQGWRRGVVGEELLAAR